MTLKALLKAPIAALIIGLTIFGASAVRAQTFQQEIESLQERAAQEYRSAQAAADNQNYDTACDGFTKSVELYTLALDRIASHDTWTPDQRSKLRGYTNGIKANADAAAEAGKAVCGRPNMSAYQYQPEDMQRIVTKSLQQASDAERQYRAHDLSGACDSSRMAAEGFHEVAISMKADPSLEAAFGNVDQVYENARQAALDRDRIYCAK